jgi:hypothetical protein
MKCSEIHPTRQNGELVDYLSSRFSPGLAYLHELLTIESLLAILFCFKQASSLGKLATFEIFAIHPLVAEESAVRLVQTEPGLRTCNTGS